MKGTCYWQRAGKCRQVMSKWGIFTARGHLGLEVWTMNQNRSSPGQKPEHTHTLLQVGNREPWLVICLGPFVYSMCVYKEFRRVAGEQKRPCPQGLHSRVSQRYRWKHTVACHKCGACEGRRGLVGAQSRATKSELATGESMQTFLEEAHAIRLARVHIQVLPLTS